MVMICFDLDGVLADFRKAFIEYINQELGTDYKTIDMIDKKPEYHKYYMQFVYSGGFATLPLTRQHYENALFAVLQDGNSVCYITSRPIEARNDTIKWLAAHGLPIGHLVFTNDKASVALRLGVDVMIEDNTDNILSLMNHGVPCILISRPYNLGVSITDVPRVMTSKQLYTSIYRVLKQ